jgi:hypothetical protein
MPKQGGMVILCKYRNAPSCGTGYGSYVIKGNAGIAVAKTRWDVDLMQYTGYGSMSSSKMLE